MTDKPNHMIEKGSESTIEDDGEKTDGVASVVSLDDDDIY